MKAETKRTDIREAVFSEDWSPALLNDMASLHDCGELPPAYRNAVPLDLRRMAVAGALTESRIDDWWRNRAISVLCGYRDYKRTAVGGAVDLLSPKGHARLAALESGATTPAEARQAARKAELDLNLFIDTRFDIKSMPYEIADPDERGFINRWMQNNRKNSNYLYLSPVS